MSIAGNIGRTTTALRSAFSGSHRAAYCRASQLQSRFGWWVIAFVHAI